MIFRKLFVPLLVLSLLTGMLTPAIAEESMILTAEALAASETAALPDASEEPADEAINPSAAPSAEPTAEPAPVPSPQPGAVPSAEATVEPTAVPSAGSSAEPSAEATVEPTAVPSAGPSAEPSADPSVGPGVSPSPQPSADPSAEATVEPTAVPFPEAILLSADKSLLGVKETAQLQLQFLPESSNDSICYSSSKPKVVKVDAFGCLTALRTGSAVITASTPSGVSSSIEITVKKAPGKLSLTAETSCFGLGESFSCTALLSKDSAGSVSFASSNPSVLRHDGNARFTAVGIGSAFIRAESYNGKTAELRIDVAAAPESIALNCSELVLGAQDSFNLTAVLPEGSASVIRYTSSDSSIASVDGSGKLTALAPGEATVSAVTFNGLSAACSVSVRPAPEDLLLQLDREKIGVNESIPLRVTLLPEGSAASLSYSVNSKSAARVSPDGVITGLRDSRPTITVTAHNGLKASIALDVENAPKSIKLTVDRNHPAVGESIRATVSLPRHSAGATSLTTDRTDILEIHPDGSITAIGPGKAILTASAYNGVSCKEIITVPPVPQQILLPESMPMGLGTSDHLPASLPEGTAGAILYESLHPEIASVDENGRLHALSLGSAVITASAANSSASAECTVRVLPLPEQMEPCKSSITLLLGQSTSIDCNFYPENSYCCLQYIPANRKIVDVDAHGKLVPLTAGVTTVTVKTSNGLTASVQLTVPSAPKSIKLSDSILYLKTGEAHMLDYSLTAGSQSIVSFISSDPEIAAVDSQTGRITAVATGTACITARTLNGKHASCAVNVNIDEKREIAEEDELKVVFMDIGRNDGIIISCGGEYAFIDSGQHDDGEKAVAYMQSLGITHLKYYIGTHAHKDHVGGAGAVLAAFDVDMIVAPHSYVFDCILRFCESQAERDAAASTPTHIMTVGEQLYIGGAKLSCIGPYSPRPHSYTSTAENNNSLVTRLTYGSNSFLLTGDATQRELLQIEENNPGSTQVDVFKNPHHNGYQPMQVIEKVMPKIVVFSTSNGSRPKSKYREMFEQLGSEIYITAPAEHSHVTITSNGKDLNVETASTPKPKK